MTELIHAMIASAAALLVLMLALWVASLLYRDASLVDRFWGPAFVVVAWTVHLVIGGAEPRALLLVVLTTLWGLRLGLYLTWRNWGEGEDPRYQKMRASWGMPRFLWVSLFTVFGLQGALAWIVSLPLQAGISAPRPEGIGWLEATGAAIWTVGFVFESVGDWQLARFKADPANRGEIMDRGLWRYTRHPNYFGDAVVWWGLFLIALPAPYGAWTVVGPIVMTVLLMKVSGVAMTERRLQKSKPGWAEYARKTSAFVPLPPKD